MRITPKQKKTNAAKAIMSVGRRDIDEVRKIGTETLRNLYHVTASPEAKQFIEGVLQERGESKAP